VAESEIENFREEILDFEDEQSEQPDWLATRAMLQLIEPTFVSEEAAATEIENWLKQCATYTGATIDQIRPDPPIVDPASGYTKVPLGVKLSGSDDQVTQFVSYVTLAGWAQSAANSTAKFYNIPEITFTGDKKDPTVLRCTLVVTRWYANNVSADNRLLPAPAAPAAPAPVAPAVPVPVEPAAPAPAAPAVPAPVAPAVPVPVEPAAPAPAAPAVPAPVEPAVPAPVEPAVPAPAAPAAPAPAAPAVPAPITPANNPLAVDPLTEDSGQN
jgi:hypothetical protein